MIGHRQGLFQKQSLQQKLSPQQIQYIKMLQMSTQAMEHRIKEELELNPTLETPEQESYEAEPDTPQDTQQENETEEFDDREIDWDAYHTDSTDDYTPSGGGGNWNPDSEDWRDLPTPYQESQLEKLESQVMLLELTEKQQLIADQILGSIEEDGYFRRDLNSVADGIAFQTGIPVLLEEVEEVLRMIQRLDPPGIAARNLRECLLIQLEQIDSSIDGRDTAYLMLKNHWDDFEKKHFAKIVKRMNLDEETFKQAYDCIKMLDPKPGSFESETLETGNYITPDFEVWYEPDFDSDNQNSDSGGEFMITLHRRNMPDLRISKHYQQMLDKMEQKSSGDKKNEQTKSFIKDKMESAKWFIDMLMQRKHTLLNVMRTIVALQDSFFRTGKGIKPMILKDVAERVNLDISTISRVVNGKYVQTPFGVYELRYFFNEGISTDSGEDVSNREVKNILTEIIENESKNKPLSDQKLTDELNKKGFQLARRTVTKYREQLKILPARLRKMAL